MARRRGGGVVVPVELRPDGVLVLDVGGRVRQTLPDGSVLEADEDARALLHPGEDFEGHSYEDLREELERSGP